MGTEAKILASSTMVTTDVNPLLPRAAIASALPQQQRRIVIPSATDFTRFDLMYYLKGALAGGICCGITHGALTPVDVVKTRMQLDPVKYNKGMIGGFKQVIAGEGAGALLTGLGPTVGGYFVQGWFKFGGVEFFKIQAV